MSHWGRSFLSLALLAVPASLVAQSLGEVAAQDKKRRQEQQKKNAGKPPVRVYTDDDLKKKGDAAEGDSPTSGAAGENVAPGEQRSERFDEGRPPRGEREGGVEAAEDSSTGDWRARADQARNAVAEAQSQVSGVEARIAELRQFLNPMSTSYAIDTNRQLEVQEELRGADAELNDAQAQVKQAQKDWAEFAEEARRAGVERRVIGAPPP
jgi:chromosome segregation ATPase